MAVEEMGVRPPREQLVSTAKAGLDWAGVVAADSRLEVLSGARGQGQRTVPVDPDGYPASHPALHLEGARVAATARGVPKVPVIIATSAITCSPFPSVRLQQG